MTRRPAWSVAFVLGFVLAAGTEVALSAALASGGLLRAGHWSLPVLFGAWTGAFVLADLLVSRLPMRTAVVLIVVAGIAMRVAALAGPPTTSDDLFRYSWDGRVQAAGIDSYADAPAAPQLVGLRESWLWPDAATCAALGKVRGCTRINRPAERTIYPPVAEAWFAVVYRVAGIGARYKAWQGAGLLTEVATLGLLLAALLRWRRDPRWLALYALCPAPVVEIVNNGHVDGLAVALIAAALVFAAPKDAPGEVSPAPWRDVVAAALIGAAFLVKLYPGVLLLPLVACRPGRRLAAALRAGTTVAVMTAVAYAPHVLAVGAKVLGYLPGYLSEEHYRSGSRFLIANVLLVPHAWGGAVSALAVAGVAAWIALRRPPLPMAGAAILAAVLLAASPAQSWYAVTLVALATVAGRPGFLAVVAAGYAASFSSVLDRPGSAIVGGWAFAAALALLVVIALRHRATTRSSVRPSMAAAT